MLLWIFYLRKTIYVCWSDIKQSYTKSVNYFCLQLRGRHLTSSSTLLPSLIYTENWILSIILLITDAKRPLVQFYSCAGGDYLICNYSKKWFFNLHCATDKHLKDLFTLKSNQRKRSLNFWVTKRDMFISGTTTSVLLFYNRTKWASIWSFLHIFI